MQALQCKVAYKGKELTVQTLLLLQSSLCLQKRKGKPIPSKREKRNQSRAKKKRETNPEHEKAPVGQEWVVEVALSVLAEVANVAQLL